MHTPTRCARPAPWLAQGIDTESDYPYVGMEGDCKERKLARHAVTIDGFEDVPPNDEVRGPHRLLRTPLCCPALPTLHVPLCHKPM